MHDGTAMRVATRRGMVVRPWACAVEQFLGFSKQILFSSFEGGLFKWVVLRAN